MIDERELMSEAEEGRSKKVEGRAGRASMARPTRGKRKDEKVRRMGSEGCRDAEGELGLTSQSLDVFTKIIFLDKLHGPKSGFGRAPTFLSICQT